MNTSNFTSNVTKSGYSLQPFALSMTRDLDDANDLIQDTLLRALLCQEKFVEGTNIKAWMYTIMKNLFINNYRRQKSRNTSVINPFDMQDIHTSGSVATNQGESNIEVENITYAINLLNPGFKVPFLMHYEGFKYEEISAKLRLPIGTIKSRIHLARKELKKNLLRF